MEDRVLNADELRVTRPRRAVLWVCALCAWAAIAIDAAPATAERVIYLDSAAAGPEDGKTWTTAFTDLQDALDEARGALDCPCEIWIAAGVYKPDRGTGDQTMAFEMASNIAIYGGFAGWETRRDQRDVHANETVLSGDLLGDDDPDHVSTSNCCISRFEPGCDDQVCEDIVFEASSDWHTGCDVRWSPACTTLAKSLCCDLCSRTRCDNSYNVLRAIETDSTAILDGVTVTGGEAAGDESPFTAGGGLFGKYSDVTVSRCTFRNNRALGATALYLRWSESRITDSTFVDNESLNGTPAALLVDSNATVTNCAFIRNKGGGLDVRSNRPIVDCRFIGNTETALKVGGSPNIVGCVFVGNSGWSGGAIDADGYPLVGDCLFLGNSASSGGGIHVDGSIIVFNSAFVGNTAMFAGAIRGGLGSVVAVNSTFVGNSADNVGGVWVSSGANVTNSVFWGNSDDYDGFDQQAQFYSSSNDPPSVNYSILQGWTGALGGVGNSGADPLLADPDGLDDILGTEDDDVRLLPGSPAIDMGDPAPDSLPPFDLDGHPRILCDRVDMGAYEFGIGDFDCDQAVDLFDFTAWEGCMTGPGGKPYDSGCEAFDFNGDNLIDLTDYAGFLSAMSEP